MRVDTKVIDSLEQQLIRTKDIPNTPYYLSKASIPKKTLHATRQSKPIEVQLLHNSNGEAGLFANTQDPIEYRFNVQSVAGDLYKRLQQFFAKFKIDNLQVNRDYIFPTNLDAATTVTA